MQRLLCFLVIVAISGGFLAPTFSQDRLPADAPSQDGLPADAPDSNTDLPDDPDPVGPNPDVPDLAMQVGENNPDIARKMALDGLRLFF